MSSFSSHRIASFLLFLVYATAGFQFIGLGPKVDEPELAQEMKKGEVYIEISLICDREFGDIFQHNKTKILEYWKALFLDVHLRFQTLQSVNLSFRIMSIIVLEHAAEQPFIEYARTANGSVHVPNVHLLFPTWLIVNGWFVPKYDIDITIAALGANIAGNVLGIAPVVRSMCKEKSLVVSVRNEDPAGVIAHEIAHTFGVRHDNPEQYLAHDCGVFNASEHLYLMADNFTGIQKMPKLRFFSPCADKIISANVQSRSPLHCVKAEIYELHPVINTAILSSSPFLSLSTSAAGISIEEQCQILINNSMGYVKRVCNATYINEEEAHCMVSTCRWDTDQEEFRAFMPFDGSPCEIRNGRCFRGLCVPPGVHLVNVANGQCLGSTNIYSSEDTPAMERCSISAFPAPLNLIRLIGSTTGLRLFMLYSTRNGNETFGKCLSLSAEEENEETISPKFEKCSHVEKFNWEIIKLEDGGDNEFLLVHRSTKRCAATSEKSTTNRVISETNCSKENRRIRWKLVWENGTVVKFDSFENLIDSPKKFEIQWFSFPFWLEYLFIPLGQLRMAVFAFCKIKEWFLRLLMRVKGWWMNIQVVSVENLKTIEQSKLKINV